MPVRQLKSTCEALVQRILQESQQYSSSCVVALVSPHSGAGVTQITRILADSLRGDADHNIAIVSASELANGDTGFNGTDIRSSLETLRKMYRFVLIDCGSIRHTQNAMRIAPLVDGVVLVAEANKTQKDQLVHAERIIENLDGRILGYVLNKRSYVVPNWLYGLMNAFGV
jgi:hypothetical protein